MSVTHTVVHRPALGEHVKADKEKQWEVSPFDKISVRSECVKQMAANEEADWSRGQEKLDHSQQQPTFPEVSWKKLAGQKFECDHGDKLRCNSYRCC